ncbi:GNAT family N-acetyltransferase [Actinocrispum sp. NPDC049592]|uniref:GNAT family N-acetyltransferase n=1 Tax=Actinocrispum sp. NPDC049592 TaxID=3154835 RepID=UPI003442B0E3
MTAFDTHRLALRPLRAGDRDAVVKIFADPESSRYLPNDMSDPVTAVASFERWLGLDGSDGTGTWVLDLNGAAIGLVRLARSSRLPGRQVEAGWFVDRAHTGQGYATEALKTVLDHGMRTLGLPAIWALIHEDNEPSNRLAAGLGFEPVAGVQYAEGVAKLHVLLPEAPAATEPKPALRTERLLIRPLRPEDRADVREVFEHSQIVDFVPPERAAGGFAEEMTERRFGYDGPPGLGHWAFIEDDILVGVGHLRPSRELPSSLAEIGWYLGVDHQGRGLATEAATALRDYGLYTLRLPAVWALVHERNEASHRLAERLGFLSVGAGHHYGGPHRVYVALPRAAAR